jgi:hypothetical protein
MKNITERERHPLVSRRAGVMTVAFVAVCGGALGFFLRPSTPMPIALRPKLVKKTASVPARQRPITTESLGAEGGTAPSQAKLHGYVLAHDGTPVANATVCDGVMRENCGSSEQCVNTDSAGAFAFPEEEVNATTLVASALGYATTVHRVDAGAERTAGAQEIRLEPDAAVVTVAGAVYDLYGGTIAGAVVSATSDPEAETGTVTLSKWDGSFALTFRRGEARLCARADGYSLVCSAISAPSGSNRLTLMPESTIIGRVVTAETGEGVPDAAVSAANVNGLSVPMRAAYSSSDGSFSIDALPPGRYSLRALFEHGRSAEARVTIGVGESSKPVLLTATPAVRLSATVLLRDRPCPDGALQLIGPISSFNRLSSDGTIDIDGLVPGAYQAVAFCRNRPSAATLLDVANRPVHHEWTIQDDREPSASEHADSRNAEEQTPITRGGTIKVTVTNREAYEMPIRIFANARSPMPLRARESGAEFTFDDLPNGEYRIQAFDDVEHARSVRIDGSGQIAEVQVVVRERGLLSGHVLDERGAPVSDAWVSYSRTDLPAGAALVDSPVLTDDQGAFAAAVTEGAEYSVLVDSPAGDARVQGMQSGQQIEIRVAAPSAFSASGSYAMGRALMP